MAAVNARTFAALSGAAYVALGVLGLIPAVWERPHAAGPISVRVFYASLFGVFTVNLILTMVHSVLGIWGVMAANDRYSSVVYARAAAAIFAVMGIAGVVPIARVSTAYGTMPLGGMNAWLYLGTAALAVIFALKPGYSVSATGMRRQINPHRP